MSVQVEHLEEKNKVRLTVEVSAEEFGAAMLEAYKKQKKDISIPGFRKGKVPMNMIEKMYGPGVFYEEAANILLPQAYSSAARESGEEIISRPDIDVTQIEKGKPFIFTAEVAVKPDVALGRYMGVEVTEIDTEVTDEDVMNEIDRERENNARIVNVEGRAIENGDTAVIDYEGFSGGAAFEGGKGENHSLEIGSGSFIPGFEEQLVGKNVGDEVEVNVTFPESYHAEDLAGKDAVFQVKIHEVKTREIPELDDEFAQDVSEFDTVDEYMASVREKIQERKKAEAVQTQKEEALEKIVADSGMDIPSEMIDMQCENMINQYAQQMAQQGLSLDQYLKMAGITLEELGNQVRPEAESHIRQDLVLQAIAKAEGIEVTDAEVDEEIEQMAAVYNMKAEQLKEYVTEDEREDMKLDIAARAVLNRVAEGMKPRAKAEADEEAEQADDSAEYAQAAGGAEEEAAGTEA
ncbi:MAG: trigger factor [Lachnospiraceae bacterium]|nr:trigger factor [Lachnospiraceae bacterium]